MFAPPAKKPLLSARKNVAAEFEGSSTPVSQNRKPLIEGPSASKRPATGTPAHWASRLSAIPRFPPAKTSDKGNEVDAVRPVCVGELPQLVRDAQLLSRQNRTLADAYTSGGLDEETSLAWIVHGKSVFIWNYLSAAGSRKCTVLDLPTTSDDGNVGRSSFHTKRWLGCIVSWDRSKKTSHRGFQSAALLLCSGKDGNLIFWPDIYNGGSISPVVFVASTELKTLNFCSVNSLIASSVPNATDCCIAFACSSGGVLWKIYCSPSGIECHQMLNFFSHGYDHRPMVLENYPRSLVWYSCFPSDKPERQFLLLTEHEIQCYEVKLSSNFSLVKLWSHEIISVDNDLGLEMNSSNQDGIYPLAVDVDGRNTISTLIGIFCKDQVAGSHYTQYSLMNMQYKSGGDVKKARGNMLEKKEPVQVIIPKAHMDGEEVLFSMRLNLGGKPSGSTIILSGDGTATVSHYSRSSLLLYQLELPNDAGKVLNASVLPILDNDEGGDWVVLTEKAGIWVVPERAVLLGGVLSPEHRSSRMGDNDIPLRDEKRGYSLSGSNVSRRSSLDAWGVGDKQTPGINEFPCQSSQDEESEALLNQLFNDFLAHGQVDNALAKLRNSGAFDKEGEFNSFSRTSKSIVDTLAKHWTAARGPEILLSLVGTLLVEKQLKHKKFLQFLALSRCHEELCSKQRMPLQTILEHGEKIAGIIQIKDLQNRTSHSTASGHISSDTSNSISSGALWNIVQLAGERSRRSSILLMDRNNTEVFYTKVSDLEEFFLCLDRHLDHVISRDASILVQCRSACELSNACVMILHGVSLYRSEHHLWYPPPEGLVPWYAKTVVCHGLSSVALLLLQLFNETSQLDDFLLSELYSNLEQLSAVLLESYSIAITAKDELKEEHESLLEEYKKLRDDILQCLYEQAKKLAKAKQQESTEENQDILMTLFSNILSVANKHEAYQTMWSICNDLNDSELLHSLMLGSTGPKDGFCCFVFEQLYASKQYSKLMRPGEDFHNELTSFLKLHPDLLWHHEIFLHQFSSASETLHAVSLSKGDTSPASAEEVESTGRGRCLNLRQRRHLLNLAKIAAFAGRDVEWEHKAKRIEADLNILLLQEEILRYMPDEEKLKVGQNLLSPVELIESCLESRNRQLSLRAFDVFSCTSLSFLQSNFSLLEDCWMNAADQDDWPKLMSLIEEGHIEGSMDLKMLKDTVIYQASSRCYGPESESSYARFHEVIPLTPAINRSIKTDDDDATQSLEAVLMKHRDYHSAGKLMRTAAHLGAQHGVNSMDEDEQLL